LLPSGEDPIWEFAEEGDELGSHPKSAENILSEKFVVDYV
jgi:hypothetical protein